MSQEDASISAPKFRLDDRPDMKETVPLGLQHILAIFVGNIVPTILVVSAAGLPIQNTNMLLRCCMLGATTSTTIRLYPIRIGSIQIDSGLPCTMGPTYAFLPVCLSIAGSRKILYTFSAQIAADVIAISYETLPKRMSPFFPPMVTGTIAITTDVSILNLTIGNTAGGIPSSDFGASINQAVGAFMTLVVLEFNAFDKGLPKVAAIPIGMMAGYILSVILGLVSFLGIGEAAWLTFPKSFTFNVKFDLKYVLMFVLLYSIVAVQVIGGLSVSYMGGLDREPTLDEVGGGATANRITSTTPTALDSFPTVTCSQNFGIVALTKVCSRFMVPVGCGIPFLIGLCPRVGAVLSTIPNCVIGGGIMAVFVMTAIPGMKLPAKVDYSNRSCLITGIPLAFGLGTQFCKGANIQFPAGIATMLGESSVVSALLLAIILNPVFLKDPIWAEEPAGKIQQVFLHGEQHWS